MAELFRDLEFNQVSFWIGLIAGVLGTWLVTKLKPGIPRLVKRIRSRSRVGGVNLISSSANRLRQDILRHVQGLHLASSIFALDEILVEPRLLTPPPGSLPDGEKPPADIFSQILPYLPDWPQLAARYSARTISLAAALGKGANLVLTGKPGAGKTVALAHLATQIIRKDQAAETLHGYLPVYVHVADLFREKEFELPAVSQIRNAIQQYVRSLPTNRLENLLERAFHSGKIMLLLDGLDEVPPELHLQATRFLSSLLETYPNSRLVVSALPENVSGLIDLGLMPVAMAAWDEKQHWSFVTRWSRSWFRFIRPTLESKGEAIDPRLLNAWLLADNPIVFPLDATLKTWAVFAGDAVGPGPVDALESYIWRMTNHIQHARSGLEDFALQMVAAKEAALDPKHTRGLDLDLEIDVTTEIEREKIQKNLSKLGKRSTRKLPGLLPKLIENGILINRRSDQISFAHPLIMTYLASAALAEAPVSHFLSSQPDWTGKELTLLFMASTRQDSPEITELLSDTGDPLLRKPLFIGRWLGYVPHSSGWKTSLMRILATGLQDNSYPLGLRARLLSALLISNDPGVSVLLRQISHTTSEDLRLLSALGMGYLLDQRSMDRLGELLVEPESSVSQAACFALAKIGNQQSFELLGSALLHGSDGIRRAAAEALALDPGEGEEILKEASQMDDLLVRRSSVYGLARVDQPWAAETLNRLSLEDNEWVVRSAATQIIEQDQHKNWIIPETPPPLHEIPWLVAFAGNQGLGIAPGVPAKNLLLSALIEGNPDEQRVALETLRIYPNQDALPQIYELMEYSSGDLLTAAFDTLLAFASQGHDIRNPRRYPQQVA